LIANTATYRYDIILRFLMTLLRGRRWHGRALTSICIFLKKALYFNTSISDASIWWRTVSNSNTPLLGLHQYSHSSISFLHYVFISFDFS
jgi:hypothetical protein